MTSMFYCMYKIDCYAEVTNDGYGRAFTEGRWFFGWNERDECASNKPDLKVDWNDRNLCRESVIEGAVAHRRRRRRRRRCQMAKKERKRERERERETSARWSMTGRQSKFNVPDQVDGACERFLFRSDGGNRSIVSSFSFSNTVCSVLVLFDRLFILSFSSSSSDPGRTSRKRTVLSLKIKRRAPFPSVQQQQRD